MNTPRPAGLLVAATLSSCASRSAAPVTPPPAASVYAARVDDLVRPLIDGEWYPAVTVTLVKGTQPELFTYGRADAAGAPPTGNTHFEIGSVSKVFTSLALAVAVERGQLDVNAPVLSLLPPGTTVPMSGDRAITLRDLATHTSGLPRMPSNFQPANPDNPFIDYDATRLMAFLSSATLKNAPGTHHDYSNLGAGLLGHALGLKTGKSYDAMVVDDVARPLGLTHTRGLHAPDARPLAQGHDSNGDEVPAWDFAALAGAGAVVSTPLDMGRLVAAALHPPDSEVGRALKRTLEEQPSAPEQRMGLGWHIGLDAEKQGSVRWHNGQTNGFHSFIAVDAEHDVGVAVLANGEGMVLDSVGTALLLMLRGQPYSIKLPPAVKVTAAELAPLVGEYVLAPSVMVTVTAKGDHLLAQLTGQRAIRVFPDGPLHFRYRVVPAELQFEKDDTGAITALTLSQNGQNTRAPRR
jgi:CubicO group peptidase (beta-lactamase class C family)